MIRAVVDTNVVFEGLTSLSASGQVVDAWVDRRFVPCVSTALALEYEEVLTNKLGDRKRPRALRALQALLDRAVFVPIYFQVRPASPDPDDDFVLEAAYNAGAQLVTRNLKDLLAPGKSLGIDVRTPEQFMKTLDQEVP
jgi:putative PIN family toxin of toxin-antitoxin system